MCGSIMLPQELVDCIIDELTDERDVLKACSLISRRWLHRSRYHLHKTLTIRHRNYYIHPAGRIRKAAALLDLPAVLAYTRILHVRGEPSNFCFHSDRGCDDESSKELFWRILEHLSHIRTVKVSELYFGDVPVEDTLRFCGFLKQATHLALSDCEFRDPDELRLVLAACPGLHALKLGWIFWSHNSSHAWSTPPPSPNLSGQGRKKPEPPAVSFARLDHLQVGYCARKMDESIVEIFLSAQAALSTTRLTLGPTDLDLEMLPSWIRVVGPTLEQLSLSFGQIASADLVRKVAGCLKFCHKLRKLTLCAKPWNASLSTNPHYWSCSLDILRNAIGLQTLDTVEFVWTISDMALEFCAGRAEVLRHVDELLAGKHNTQPLNIIFTTRTLDGKAKQKFHSSWFKLHN